MYDSPIGQIIPEIFPIKYAVNGFLILRRKRGVLERIRVVTSYQILKLYDTYAKTFDRAYACFIAVETFLSP